MSVLEERIINGKKEISFNPDLKMKLFAYAVSCDPRYIGLAPEEVLPAIGLRRDMFTRWQRDYDPYFSEWLEGVMMTFRGGNIKKMLEFVGLQRAFDGEFNYWKAFALREKVISPDQMNVGVIPATLGVYSEWSAEQVEQHSRTLLEALRGESDPTLGGPESMESSRSDSVAEQTPGGGSEVRPCGATEMPEVALVLAESLGAD